MADAYRVEMDTVDGGPTALGRAGSFTLVSDRPASAGGHGLGFNGGQLLNLAVAACISTISTGRRRHEGSRFHGST